MLINTKITQVTLNDSNTETTQSLVRIGLPSAPEVNQRDLLRIGAQEFGLAVAVLPVSNHGDPFAGGFKGIADGANSQQATQYSFRRAAQLRQPVADPRGQDQ